MNELEIKSALTYDDIQLVPTYSEVESRKNISLTTQLTTNYKLMIPLVASPMDTVCEYKMAKKLTQLGGAGVIHRFMSIEEQSKQVKMLYDDIQNDESLTSIWYVEKDKIPIMAAIGSNGDFLERAKELVKSGANVLVIDVAHGHHINVKNAIESIRSENLKVDIIAGNIATSEAAIDLQKWGVDGLRVGIGGGSLCTTRIKTGFGVPNVTSLYEIVKVATVPVMADGGIRTSGDIAKALAIGASNVMLGSLLAGTEESPGKIIDNNGLYKRYRGSASLETKTVHNQEARNVEGESTIIPYKGGTKFIIDGLIDGVRSALSYGGASNLNEFKPKIVRVTTSGILEAKPHLIK